MQQEPVAGAQQFHSRLSVNAPRLNANEAVLDHMHANTDPMLSADLVGSQERAHNIDRSAIDLHRLTSLEPNCENLALVGRVLGPYTHLRCNELRWRIKRLQFACLMSQAQQVGVGRISLVA